MRRKEEIYEQIDACENSDNFGMTYEDGVKATLEWILGYSNDKPIEIEKENKLEIEEENK